ncbi:hypothetical protein ACFYMI_39530 [Streptomyces collinus]|uniref:hypothetical protein n=1 Tax=Streptomyces collinus TaxID=42684 RepID=UPI0036B25936
MEIGGFAHADGLPSYAMEITVCRAADARSSTGIGRWSFEDHEGVAHECVENLMFLVKEPP